MQTIERGGYSREEILDVLHGKYGSRVVKFRYDLLDNDDNYKGELGRVLNGEVSMSAFSTIKRTARFTLEEETIDVHSYFTWQDVGHWRWSDLEDSNITRWSEAYTTERDAEKKIDWLTDKIQPFVLFKMPDDNWIEFPLGIFIPATPVQRDTAGGEVRREVEAYDGLVVLNQDRFTERWTVRAGTTYKKAVEDILKGAGVNKFNLEFTGNITLNNDKEYGVGTTKLEAINDLLSTTNNVPLWVDAYGYYTSYPYRSPAQRGADYTYDTDELSIVVQGIEEELDIFDVPNSWVVTVSNPESTPMVARRENRSSSSPTSIQNRRRTIVDFREIEDISSRDALESYVDRIAFESSQVFGRVRFKTPIMPFHEYYDVLRFKYDPLEINDLYAETSWTIKLTAGAYMEHEARRVVEI
ncbi:hypothetical protein BpsS36_00022 [Bacillus phage vB_BpsS-36]|uniref:Minor tail protein n=1 Tax=Bacillus phage vB_BpsS-36 TaxID=2419622 RepID=A0A3G3BWY7_9CAUD|nr:hypothetical protein BpsS36_00022 [Bacillus phage vB_BpsS-36]